MYVVGVWSISCGYDGSGIPGEEHGILTKLAEKHEHVGDKHDSTYALALEDTRKDMVKSMQTPGIASKLMWIYWHHDPDSQWFDNWVLLKVTLYENAVMTREMVHEVMHDTSVVKMKKTVSRMQTSGGTVKFERVHLGNIAVIARTRTGVFLSSKPLGFHGCGRGGVWDLTSHITCLVSQSGQTGNDAQEEFDLCFNRVEWPVQVYLPPKIYHDALGFILKHLPPVAHEREEMPDNEKNEDLLL